MAYLFGGAALLLAVFMVYQVFWGDRLEQKTLQEIAALNQKIKLGRPETPEEVQAREVLERERKQRAKKDLWRSVYLPAIVVFLVCCLLVLLKVWLGR